MTELNQKISMYPVSIDLEGKNCLVVGGGRVAERKILGLLGRGANITVIAPETTARITALAGEGVISLQRRDYIEGEATGYFLVIASTGSSRVNRLVSENAGTSNRLVNVVDTPELSNFYVPSVLQRGDLQIAVSTGGASPALAKEIRENLEDIYAPEYSKLLDRLRSFRCSLLESEPDPETRRSILTKIVHSPEIRRYIDGDEEPLEMILRKWT